MLLLALLPLQLALGLKISFAGNLRHQICVADCDSPGIAKETCMKACTAEHQRRVLKCQGNRRFRVDSLPMCSRRGDRGHYRIPNSKQVAKKARCYEECRSSGQVSCTRRCDWVLEKALRKSTPHKKRGGKRRSK